MKIRKLESEFDNLMPGHVFNDVSLPNFDKYQELWYYALTLEKSLSKTRRLVDLYREEVRHLNFVLSKKQRRIKAINSFIKAFPMSKIFFKESDQ